MKEHHRRILVRGVVVVALLVTTFLWLRELTLRHAREEADVFMRPLFIRTHHWYYSARFSWVDSLTDLEKIRLVPGWVLYYEANELVMERLTVRVSLFGSVTGTNHDRLNNFLAMPHEERDRAMWEWCRNGFKDVEHPPGP